ncbi:Uncharacterised protein [Bordetella pertussis]|nr:Uncharacterised protein [Bordetella pertussis]
MTMVSKVKRSSHSSSRLSMPGRAPSERSCSPWWRSASSMVWRTSAVTMGTTRMVCATTMALNENSQPRKPNGPECESSR